MSFKRLGPYCEITGGVAYFLSRNSKKGIGYDEWVHYDVGYDEWVHCDFVISSHIPEPYHFPFVQNLINTVGQASLYFLS